MSIVNYPPPEIINPPRFEKKNYEHIIVADCPPGHIVGRLHEAVRAEDNGKITLIKLKRRYNNWGIKPASIGIGLSRGGKGIRYRVMGKISLGWIITPIAACLLTFIMLFFVKNVFELQVIQ